MVQTITDMIQELVNEFPQSSSELHLATTGSALCTIGVVVSLYRKVKRPITKRYLIQNLQHLVHKLEQFEGCYAKTTHSPFKVSKHISGVINIGLMYKSVHLISFYNKKSGNYFSVS